MMFSAFFMSAAKVLFSTFYDILRNNYFQKEKSSIVNNMGLYWDVEVIKFKKNIYCFCKNGIFGLQT